MLLSVNELIRASAKLYQENTRLFLQYVAAAILPTLGIIIVGFFFFMFVLAGAGNHGNSAFPDGAPTGTLIAFAIAILLAGIFSLWVSLATVRVIAKRIMGQTVEPMARELGTASRLVLPAIGAGVASSLLTLLGIILFFIPGVIAMGWFAFVFHAVAIDGDATRAALTRSKHLVQGRWFGLVWRLIGPALFFGVLSLVLRGMAEFATNLFLESTAEPTLGLIVSLFSVLISIAITIGFAPFPQIAQTILYLEAKKTPTTPPPSSQTTTTM